MTRTLRKALALWTLVIASMTAGTASGWGDPECRVARVEQGEQAANSG